MSDIREIYLQIKLQPEDQPYHRFLWRNLETDKEPDIFEFDQAQFVAREHAKKHQPEFPLAAETILESTYMDDSMDSVPDVRTAVELYNQLSELWGSAGMHARKWLSNEPEVSFGAFHLQTVRPKLISIVVNYLKSKPWEFLGAPWKMCLSFKSTGLLRNVTKQNETS